MFLEMNAPQIDWFDPIFPAVCLTLMFVAAYGGLRGDNPIGLIHAAAWLYLAWTNQYLAGEKEKALPRQSYLVDPLPKIRP
jgi:hypothetical protein